MPMQTRKDQLIRTPGDQNLWIYGGWFDIANCSDDWDTLLTMTKINALFYERILVFDGYFCCKGPLYEGLTKAYRSKYKKSNWTEEDFREHEILKLFDAGIVVPGRRQEKPMADTFRNGERGIAPGQYMTVDLKNGEQVLEMVDAVSRYFYVQPKLDSTNFHNALWDSLTNQKVPIGCVLSNPRAVEHVLKGKDAIRARTILEDFSQKLESERKSPDFRRGWVENWAADTLKLDLENYSTFINRVNFSDLRSTAAENIVFQILRGVSTAYELMHAEAFECQAGLFTFHDPEIPGSGSVRQVATATMSQGPKVPRSVKIDGLPKRKGLSVDDVIKFRSNDKVFGNYCERVRALRMPAEGEDLLTANPGFKEFFFNEYAHAIVELLRNSSAAPSESGVKLMELGVILDHHAEQMAETIDIGAIFGLPFPLTVKTILRGAGQVIETVGGGVVVNNLLEQVRVARSVERFEKNNYQLFQRPLQ